MNKFKEGDLVRCIQGDVNWGLSEGCVYTATYESGVFQIREPVCGPRRLNGANMSWHDDRFELVSSADADTDQELRQLVATANAGYVARERLISQYGDRCSMYLNFPDVTRDGQNLRQFFHAGKNRQKEIRIIPKKKEFKSFWLSEGHEVSIWTDERYITIGCKRFFITDLLAALRALCPNYGLAVHGAFTSSRSGFTFEVNAISWESADRLLAALEEYLK